MNILIVSHHGLYKSLDTSFVHAQAMAYAEGGHNVRVLVLVALGKRAWDQGRVCAKRFVTDKVEIFPVRFISFSKYGTRRLNTVTAKLAVASKLGYLTDGFPIDIIHAHTFGFDSKIGIYLKEQLKVPLVVTTHGDDTSVPFEKGQICNLKDDYDQVDTIVAVSSSLANMVQSSGTGTQIRVILNGFRCNNLPCNIERIPGSIIQVGQLNHQKRFSVTIDGFSKINALYPNTTLTLIGDGEDRALLEKQCKILGIENSVRFMGQISNKTVLKEMSSHQFFVMPSVREGFGIVYLEAMAAGCITIGTQGEGISDFIRNGENGFLIPPDDPNSLKNIIEWCLTHCEEAQKIARQGQRDAILQTWEKNAKEMVSLLYSIIGPSDG